MYKIIITSDSNKHFEHSILEYIKRLGKKIEIIKLKPIKNGTDDQIIQKETQNTIDKLLKINGFKIVLNPVGKSFSTNDFFNLLEKQKSNFGTIVFIVGGANGLNYSKLKGYIDLEVNLGNFTMPHSLAFLIIIEQIYRVEMIKKGTSYNK